MVYITVTFLAANLILAATKDVQLGNIFSGRLIFELETEASPALWRQTKYITVNTKHFGEFISGIKIWDLRLDKDGEVNILSGGPGQKEVTIELKSPSIFRGFAFYVQVFADIISADTLAPSVEVITPIDVEIPYLLDPGSKELNRVQKARENSFVGEMLSQLYPTAKSRYARKKPSWRYPNSIFV